MNTTSPPPRHQTALPPSPTYNEMYYYEPQEPTQEEALEFHRRAIQLERQSQAQSQSQSSTSPEKSKGEKVLDNSIKAANWLIWGDIDGKEAREQKKKEKKERRKRRKEGKDDGEEEEERKKKKKKEKREGEDSELKKRKRDDDGVEDDWVMEILQAIA
ncbi:hypothetical protein TWF506_007580 [Arthrobotrys conoides]|uniref:Uncharacterized protein n=1 Tax=Arthrobotrys conoides TaxID=74498 RepID=A0AAN8NQ18_9PEZI